ncbi:MAG: DNA cytosine methyltransferase [Epsilonproteobacteria bacterium]|nr:DNA cytosine methyltransferase [Campylobacterota bacterium]
MNANNEKNTQAKYKAIDLFAGIGGIRLGFQQAFGEDIEFVFSSEIDRYAQQTYYANFGELPHGDITKIDEKEIPPHDIILAGFPCQAFSIAGHRRGFEDTRGTLFFEVARIAAYHKPKIIFLENVKGFVNHDKGNTFKVVKQTLENMGYRVFAKVLNAKDFGIPQNRERIYIVAFLNDTEFEFPEPLKKEVKVGDILEKQEVSNKYYLSDTYVNTLKKHKARHLEKGNGFGYQILKNDGIANTLVVGGMGKERNLVYDNRLTDWTSKTNIKGSINKDYIRKLTPREWAKLQGFPDEFKISVSDAQAYKQFGNSVCVPVVKHIAAEIIKKGKQ